MLRGVKRRHLYRREALLALLDRMTNDSIHVTFIDNSPGVILIVSLLHVRRIEVLCWT